MERTANEVLLGKGKNKGKWLGFVRHLQATYSHIHVSSIVFTSGSARITCIYEHSSLQETDDNRG